MPFLITLLVAGILSIVMPLTAIAQPDRPLISACGCARPPPQIFIIWFRSGRANLLPPAAQIVKEAAQAASTKNNAKLSVHGYTDTTESIAYNIKLSLRRANNVAARLIADGIPRREVTVKAYGETQPLVRMPQIIPNRYNRRVEILVR